MVIFVCIWALGRENSQHEQWSLGKEFDIHIIKVRPFS